MIIVHVVEPFAGGIIAFLKSLVNDATGDKHIFVHGEREHVLKVSEAKKQLSFSSNVKYIHWKSAQRSIHPIKDFAALVELYKILKRLKQKGMMDAVHLHSSKSGFLGRIVCRMLNIKNVIYTPNGAPFLVGKSSFSNFMYKQLERVGSMFGGQVVCCSQSEQEAYAEAGITAIRINNGIPVSKTWPTNHPNLEALRSPGRKLRIVTSGRILDQKNPQLFNAIAKHFEGHPSIEFTWIGYGPDAAMITAKNINITGWLDPAVARSMVAEADVYMSTARFEGLSFAVLEALALRKPLLLSDCVGNRDMIDRGLNGDLFNTAEEAVSKINHYYNNMDKLPSMGEHSGLHCVRSFDVEMTQQLYRELYATSLRDIPAPY